MLFVTVSVLLVFSASAQSGDYDESGAYEGSGFQTFEGSGSEGSGTTGEGDWTCQQCRDGSIGVGNFYIDRYITTNFKE